MNGCCNCQCEHKQACVPRLCAPRPLLYPATMGKMPLSVTLCCWFRSGVRSGVRTLSPFWRMSYADRDVPRERLLAVADHYYHFDGRSPINDQNRALIAALGEVVKIPIYWGNRNWHPLLADTVHQMRDDGIRRAIAFPTSAFGSYSGCRQYLENIQSARAEAGDNAPEIVKIPPFSEHPLFLEAMTDRVRAALAELPGARVVFTAHSVPVAMAQASPYVEQLEAASRRVAEAAAGGRVDAGVSEPQRASHAALAGAGHLPLSAGIAA